MPYNKSAHPQTSWRHFRPGCVTLALAVILAPSLWPQTPTVSLSPTGGSGTGATFYVSAAVPSGFPTYNLQELYLVFSNQSLSSADCEVALITGGTQFYLLNGAQTAWLGPIYSGSGSLGGGTDDYSGNTRCQLSGSGSGVSGAGGSVTAYFSLSFLAGFTPGTETTWVAATDTNGQNSYNSYWQSNNGQGGYSTWTIPGHSLTANARPAITFPSGCNLVFHYGVADPTRSGDNQLTASAYIYPDTSQTPGPQIQGSWQLTETITLFFTPTNGSQQTVTTAQQTATWGSTTPLGTTSQVNVSAAVALEPQGSGYYQTGDVVSVSCGGQTSTLDPAYSNAVQINRPFVSGQSGLWWLNGFSDSTNGYYSQSTLTANTNCLNCTSTPSWTVSNNAAAIGLSCNNCSTTTATAQKASTNANDITVQFSLSGFNSVPFTMTVAEPYYLASAAPTDNLNDIDGWESRIYYKIVSNFNQILPSIAYNELFGGWQDDYFNTTGVHNTWIPPTASGKTGFAGDQWFDDLYEYSCANLTPACANPGQDPLGPRRVQSAPQYWYVGSSTPGFGVYVQTDTHVRYTDHGEHQAIVSPPQ